MYNCAVLSYPFVQRTSPKKSRLRDRATLLFSEPPLPNKATHPPLSSGRPSPECNQLEMRRDRHIGSCPLHLACACGLQPWALDWAPSGQQRHPQMACNNSRSGGTLSRLHQLCEMCVTSRAKATEATLFEHMQCIPYALLTSYSNVLCHNAVRSQIQVSTVPAWAASSMKAYRCDAETDACALSRAA